MNKKKDHCLFHFDGCIGLAFLLEVEANTIHSAVNGIAMVRKQ